MGVLNVARRAALIASRDSDASVAAQALTWIDTNVVQHANTTGMLVASSTNECKVVLRVGQ